MERARQLLKMAQEAMLEQNKATSGVQPIGPVDPAVEAEGRISTEPVADDRLSQAAMQLAREDRQRLEQLFTARSDTSVPTSQGITKVASPLKIAARWFLLAGAKEAMEQDKTAAAEILVKEALRPFEEAALVGAATGAGTGLLRLLGQQADVRTGQAIDLDPAEVAVASAGGAGAGVAGWTGVQHARDRAAALEQQAQQMQAKLYEALHKADTVMGEGQQTLEGLRTIGRSLEPVADDLNRRGLLSLLLRSRRV